MLAEDEEPVVRVTRIRLAAYIVYLDSSLASRTTWCYVHGLTMALRALNPAAEVAWIVAIAGKLNHVAVPSRRKRDRIVPARDLFELGLELMAAPPPADSLMAAARFRDGLAIAILAARPIRMRNLQMMEFDRHLTRVGNTYWLRFTSEETKTHQPISLALPELLTDRIEIYVARHRPMLLMMHVDAQLPVCPTTRVNSVWISSFGNRMSAASLFERITIVTKKRFGKPINPHLFRDCAATSIALGDETHIHITMSLLGHASSTTSDKYYNHALTREASNMQQREIAKLRRSYRINKASVKSR
jgi:integrase